MSKKQQDAHYYVTGANLIIILLGIFWLPISANQLAKNKDKTLHRNETPNINQIATSQETPVRASINLKRLKRQEAMGQAYINGQPAYQAQPTLNLNSAQAEIAAQNHMKCALSLLGQGIDLKAADLSYHRKYFVIYTLESPTKPEDNTLD
ncbi:MAG: hypothetical protein ACRCX7_10965 [Cetobacterium sp.]|uniref:hypothetical protein n=1 Tax=Cetobacterium sp. TaxID=2071632 RepID=UPI003F38A50A